MSDSFQHVLYRNVIITATAAEVMKTLLVTKCFATYSFCWWLTATEQNESRRCHRLIQLYGLSGLPYGWMRLPNELSESVVPTFACVVGTNTGQ